MGLDRAKFRHSTRMRVRNYEIDWQGIVHNANYLLYFELGRLAYLEQLGIKNDLAPVQGDTKVVVARNEIDYRFPARFPEDLDVLTRIAYIRDTCFSFEGIIEEARTRPPVSENVSVRLWLDGTTGTPRRVSEEFWQLATCFEGSFIEIQA